MLRGPFEASQVAFYEELYCGDQSLDPNGLVGTYIILCYIILY